MKLRPLIPPQVLLQADVLELKANPARDATGAVLEARVEKGLGTVATTLVQRGTLRVGDVFVAGAAWGKVRALLDDEGARVDEAGPSSPVQVNSLARSPPPSGMKL
jgi:translation initiation factor IF-2